MSNFTPGPWKWDDGVLVAQDGFVVISAGLNKNGSAYVSVHDDDNLPILEAAPDLYEALEEARIAIQNATEIMGSVKGDPEFATLAKVDAALSRARGEG